jgi:hypothetical protein
MQTGLSHRNHCEPGRPTTSSADADREDHDVSTGRSLRAPHEHVNHTRSFDATVEVSAVAVVGEEGVEVGQQAHRRETIATCRLLRLSYVVLRYCPASGASAILVAET